MQKIILICFMMGLTVLQLSGQGLENENPERLLSEIRRSGPDTTKVKLLLARSRQLLFKPDASAKDIDSSIDMMQQARQLSLQLKDIAGQGNTRLMAALIYNKEGDRGKGLELTQQALKLFEGINDLKGQAETHIILGQHYGNDGKDLAVKMAYYQKAIDLFARAGAIEREATTLADLADLESNNPDYYFQSYKHLNTALSLYKSIGYKRVHGVYNLLGSVLKELGDLTESLKYQLLATSTAEELGDLTQLPAIYNHTGMCYYTLKKYPEAAGYYEKGLSLALKFHDTSGIICNSANLMSTYASENNLSKAAAVYERLPNLNQLKTDLLSQVVINGNMLDIYTRHGQYRMAGIFFQRVKNLVGSDTTFRIYVVYPYIDYYIMTRRYNDAYEFLSAMQRNYEGATLVEKRRIELASFKIDSAFGKLKEAIEHYQRYKILDDSLFSLTKNKQVAFFQAEFETQQKEKDIQLLRKEAQLQKLAAGATINLWEGGAGALLLLLGIGYSRFRLKQRKNLELQGKQEKINRQNTALQYLITEKDCLLNEKDSLLAEKEWLLKEIHHRVKNNLQIVMGLLQQQSVYISNETALAAIQNSENRMRSISLIHQKLYQTDNLNLIYMSEYINELISYLKDSFDLANRVCFEKELDEIYLDVSQAVPLGLILNEAITNAIKYGYPNNETGIIYISLCQADEEINLLTIKDQGPGLPSHLDLTRIESLGLNLMQGLSKQLHGTFEIHDDNGVHISVMFKTDKFIGAHAEKTTTENLLTVA